MNEILKLRDAVSGMHGFRPTGHRFFDFRRVLGCSRSHTPRRRLDLNLSVEHESRAVEACRGPARARKASFFDSRCLLPVCLLEIAQVGEALFDDFLFFGGVFKGAPVGAFQHVFRLVVTDGGEVGAGLGWARRADDRRAFDVGGIARPRAARIVGVTSINWASRLRPGARP